MHTPSRMVLVCTVAASATACVQPLTPAIPMRAAPMPSERSGPTVSVDLEDPADSLSITLNGVLLHRGGLYDDPPSLRQNLRQGRNEVEIMIVRDSAELSVEDFLRGPVHDSSTGRSYRTVTREVRVALTATVWGCPSGERDCDPPGDMLSGSQDVRSRGAGTTGALRTGTFALSVNGEQAYSGDADDLPSLQAAIRRSLVEGRNDVVIEGKKDAREVAEPYATMLELAQDLLMDVFGATSRMASFAAVVTRAIFALHVCAAGDVSCVCGSTSCPQGG